MIEHWTEFQGGQNGADKDKARVTLNNRGVVRLNLTAYEAEVKSENGSDY